ncbi:MAG TPA: aminopeptidase N [Mycobacteriales bacterium]|nr:aminopeptidase N [Mycobacteriales bacterium]
MSDNNLTRDEARERAALISGVTYAVTLDLRFGEEQFESTTVVEFRCAEAGASTFLELTAPAVRRIVLNGADVDAAAFDGNRLHLTGLAADNIVEVVADCAYMHTGVGLHRFVDPVDKRVYLHTQFETFDAHRVYACFDQPDLKAPFTLTVHAPEDWVVISNARPVERPAAGAAGEWRFAPTPPISTYITAVVAGPYHEVRETRGGIDLGLFCRRSMAEHLDVEELFTVTEQGFAWFQEAFACAYPFGDKYDQLFVPEFNAGAMENAACVTFLEDYVFRSKVTDASYERRAETILHEMAHMWFGDLVTMRWWDDLWLNESFATYASILCQVKATRFTGAWTTFANKEKTWAYRQDQLSSTHPVAADMVDIHTVEVNFDGITYAKGASVLRQLVAWVGEDAFLAGLRTYFARHAFGNTELEDLLATLEESSGRDLSSWSKEWLETAGVNTMRASFAVDAKDAFTSFRVLQEAPADWPTLRSHRVAIGLYDIDSADVTGGTLVRRQRVELDVVGASTEVPELVGVRRPDLILVNDDDLTYAKIRLDDRSLATVTDRLGQLPDSLPRALCWAASWDMTRDGELPARDYLSLVLHNIGSETDIGVVQTLLSQSLGAIYNYGDPASRDAELERIASASLDHLHAAVPESDHQLAWARAFVSSAQSAAHRAMIADLLSGAVTVPGLAIDTELRWHLVRRLSALGDIDAEQIAVEVERDPTAAGHRHGAAALASRPTQEAKREAWASIVDDPDLPNAVLSATMSGFQQPQQVELLEEYVEPFFAAMTHIWATRTSEVAQNITTGMYPSGVIHQDTRDRTDAYIREADPAPALRRLLLEGRDGVARALRARAAIAGDAAS